MDVRERALYYLNIKPRTRKQVERYLKEKGFSEDEILPVLKELEEYSYIDDLSYSIMYFELGFEKGRGKLRIKRELAERVFQKISYKTLSKSLKIPPMSLKLP